MRLHEFTSTIGSFRRVFRALMIFSALSVMGCEENIEPFFNQQAAPPDLRPRTLSGIQQGTRVLGTVNVWVNRDSIGFPVKGIQWGIDSIVGHVPPYFLTQNETLSLYTKNYSDGRHTVIASVYSASPNQGLANFLDLPSKIFTTELIFDNKPPSPITMTGTWTDYPRVTWTQSPDSNFFEYILAKNYNRFPPTDPSVIAHIRDRSDTSYTDSTLKPIFGNWTYYTVAASNSQDYSYSLDVQLLYGTPFFTESVDYSYIAAFPYYPAGNEFIMRKGGTLRFRSASTYAITRELGGFPSFPHAAVNPDGTTLAVVQDTRLQVFDLASLRLLVTSDFGGYTAYFDAPAVDSRNRIYVPAMYGAIQLFNGTTGNYISSVYPPFQNINYLYVKMEYSPTDKMLYVADLSALGTGDAILCKIATDTSAPSIVLTRQYPSTEIWKIQANRDGTRLYVLHQQRGNSYRTTYVDILETAGLNSVGQIPLPAEALPDDGVSAFCLGRDYAYLGYTILDGTNVRGKVERINTSTLQVERSWTFMNKMWWLQESADARYLYALGNGPQTEWLVPIE